MRRPYTILFILFSFTSFGQEKLKGTYCSPADFVGYCLTFKNDSLFEYSSWSCLSSEKGNGTYKQDKNKLTLNFISDDTLKNSFAIKETNCNTTDSITLTFLIIDKETNEALPFANIWLTGLPNETKGTLTDINGNASIKVKSPKKEFEINISYVGYKRSSYKINADNCKDIKVYLANSFNNFVENGTKWEYKIKKTDPNKLTLRQDKFDIILTRQK